MVRIGPVSSPDKGHWVVTLGGKLYTQSASLHPSKEMATGKVDAEG